jgi:hypothetical protein
MCDWTFVHCDKCGTYMAPHKPILSRVVLSVHRSMRACYRSEERNNTPNPSFMRWIRSGVYSADRDLEWMIPRPGNVECTPRMHCPISLPVMFI